MIDLKISSNIIIADMDKFRINVLMEFHIDHPGNDIFVIVNAYFMVQRKRLWRYF